MKSSMRVLSTVALFLAMNASFADQVALDLSTSKTANWSVTGGGVTNVAPFFYYNDSTTVNGISVTSTGNTGSGFFLPGGSFKTFDGFWTANANFFLPANATNISLSFSNFGCDDRAVLLLNESIKVATAASLNSGATVQGRMVLEDRGTNHSIIFRGPNLRVSGVVTNGFIIGATNALKAIINNTGQGVNGNVANLNATFDYTWFGSSIIVAYDVPALASISIALHPALTIDGNVGVPYQIEYTTDLGSGVWTVLTNLTLPTSPYLFLDPEAVTNSVKRFYRLVRP